MTFLSLYRVYPEFDEAFEVVKAEGEDEAVEFCFGSVEVAAEAFAFFRDGVGYINVCSVHVVLVTHGFDFSKGAFLCSGNLFPIHCWSFSVRVWARLFVLPFSVRVLFLGVRFPVLSGVTVP